MPNKPRFTAHTYGSYWWICDNLTGQAVVNKANRRLFYHINTHGLEKAARMAQMKAVRLNREERGC